MRNYPSAEKLDIFVLLVWVHTIKIIQKQLRHIVSCKICCLCQEALGNTFTTQVNN